jgi:phosphoribosylanthranilate isomerase
MTAVHPHTPRVKICGLRDPEHACFAADAGADLLGFVFVEGVRRQLHPHEGRAVVDRYRESRNADAESAPKLVGLFRDQPLDWVRSVIEDLALDFAQLCGGEDLDYGAALGVPALRQVRVKEGDTPADVTSAARKWLDVGHMALLDRYDPATPGGAGITFDWRSAEGVAEMEGVLLAGGLTPENVALAVRRLRPWGVDVASGVETDGEKDPDKIRAFVRAARGV